MVENWTTMETSLGALKDQKIAVIAINFGESILSFLSDIMQMVQGV